MTEVLIHVDGNRNKTRSLQVKDSDHALRVIDRMKKRIPRGSSTYFTIKVTGPLTWDDEE
jgi:hypothetical protein